MSERAPGEARCCPVVELRQYTLGPGRRDELVELFDMHFVEGQESVGMTIIGQFRDQLRPDRFVWLRGFPDMERRRRALEAFYGGPVWAQHGPAANDTMLEFDDVLLLKPASPKRAFGVPPIRPTGSRSLVVAGIHRLPCVVDAELVERFEREVVPGLETNGLRIEGVFETESATNTFPRLPVREGENVVAWFASVDGPGRPPGWLDDAAGPIAVDGQPASILYLEPTSRSTLGNRPRAARA